MELKIATAPAVEPVSLTTAKLHCRVDTTADDDLITALIVAARRHVEAVSRRALITQTWDYVLDDWPDTPFEIPLPPLQSITSITYVDEDGDSGTVDSGDYIVDSWPSDTLQDIAGVRVRFVAGYADAATDVPQHFIQAMLLLIGHWYENREAVATSGAVPKQLELAVKSLLWQDRMMSFP